MLGLWHPSRMLWTRQFAPSLRRIPIVHFLVAVNAQVLVEAFAVGPRGVGAVLGLQGRLQTWVRHLP